MKPYIFWRIYFISIPITFGLAFYFIPNLLIWLAICAGVILIVIAAGSIVEWYFTPVPAIPTVRVQIDVKSNGWNFLEAGICEDYYYAYGYNIAKPAGLQLFKFTTEAQVETCLGITVLCEIKNETLT